MIQVLCYTGRGFDTCWRPSSIACHVVKSLEYMPHGLPTFAIYSTVRFA